MRENQFSAFNYLVPATGTTSGFNIQSDFAVPYAKNFAQLAIDTDEFHPSGVFIDNSQGKSALTITIVETGQQIVCQAGALKQTQYPAPIEHSVTIASASNVAGFGVANVTFVDFPVMPFETKGIPFGTDSSGTVDATGTQVVVPAGQFSVHCTIQNTDAANDLLLSFTQGVVTATPFRLKPGQSMTFPGNGFANALYGKSTGVTTAFAIIGA